MACYDKKTLTAALDGELATNLKTNGGLAAALDESGIYVNCETVGAENGAYISSNGKLAARLSEAIPYQYVSGSSVGYSPLPIGQGAAVVVSGTAGITFTNTTARRALMFLKQTYTYNVEVDRNSEWHALFELIIQNPGEFAANSYKQKMRNRNIDAGTWSGHESTISYIDFRYLLPGATETYYVRQRHWAGSGTVQLLQSSNIIEAFGYTLHNI